MNADPSTTAVAVLDSFGAANDPRMHCLKRALDPMEAQERIGACWAQAKGDRVELRAIRVPRYKPERRCLIEYELCAKHDHAAAPILVLGKARAKGTDRKTFELQQALGRSGFNADSADGIFVAEAIGTIPEFQMWLQMKVPGVPVSELLATAGGAALAARVADAAHKLHRSNIPASRQHTMDDELRILRERLGQVMTMKPDWRARLERLLAACHRLARRLPPPRACGIHRDFYPAQVIVDGTKLCLTDLDLYCEGDPALDIGNFLGHMTEQSLRCLGNANALREQETALAERFAELPGLASRMAVEAYATLTLARHIFLSTQFPERQPFTAPLLDLCEERLADV